MNRIPLTIATLATTALIAAPTPAQAAPVCISTSELAQLSLGLPIAQVGTIVGGPGTYLPGASAAIRPAQVFQWSRCEGGTVNLTFSGPRGSVLTAIG